ncbi:MAG TPA: hypothetical protein VGG39_31755 [Polyangiaceae bacterium]
MKHPRVERAFRPLGAGGARGARGAGAAAAALAALAALVALAAACGGPHARAPGEDDARGFRETGLRAPDDPTVHEPRVLPLAAVEGRAWGTSAGGGARRIVAGERVVSWGDGSIAASPDRLAGTPEAVVELPERMGGGFVFAIGPRLWQSDAWLARAVPVATLGGPIASLSVGLDRVYVRAQAGGVVGYDPAKHAIVGLGPVPATPTLGQVAAIDAWRAVAVADLRGAMITLDAGSTWRALPVPIEPLDLVLAGDAIAVGGNDGARTMQWWEVRADGQVGRLGSGAGALDAITAPVVHGARTSGDADRDPDADAASRAFGPRPLAAAIADGWPLTDGTAVVARDGAMARVRLSDGALVETVRDAFPLAPARCHPFDLADLRADVPRDARGASHAADAGAFGFACGEARGRTVLYRFDGRSGRLVEMRRFDGPREVLSSGNGAIAVRGGCAPDAGGDVPGEPDDGSVADVAYCLLPAGGDWREMHFRNQAPHALPDDIDRARVVVLSDGRVALVRPPRDADVTTARITITDGTTLQDVAVKMPAMRADVSRAVRIGLWMDGFEERRPGVLGGWIDAGGSLLGIELALDGTATLGTYLHAAGDVFVSGRYGLGWSASRRGTETTDGGMTWKDLELPEPIAPPRAVKERACGPVGCIAAGWMRVGWGEGEKAHAKEAPARVFTPSRGAPPLRLSCEALSGKPVEQAAAAGATKGRASPPRARTGVPFPPPLLMMSPAVQGLTDLGRFLARPAPALAPDESGVAVDVTGGMETVEQGAPYARIDAWGPSTGDWDQLGRWRIYWLWPFGGWPEERASATAPSPWTGLDAARRALVPNGASVSRWLLATGDDADHALLVGRHLSSPPTAEVLELEADRAPMEVRRAGGEPLPDVEAAVRAGSRWYLATAEPAGDVAATVVWMLDGSQAREIARLPRTVAEPHGGVRLARRMDGRALGVLVDGQPAGDGGPYERWVASVDLETGAVGEPEELAPFDLSDRSIAFCTGDDSGWQVDLPYPGTVRIENGTRGDYLFQNALARMRLSTRRACVERLAGAMQALPQDAPWVQARSTRPFGRDPLTRRGDVRTIDVEFTSSRMRYAIRCTRL